MIVARESVSACVALGANLGDALSALKLAVNAIETLPLTRVTKTSAVYQTAPVLADGAVESSGGDDYLNAVVEVSTGLNAPELLAGLQQIEAMAGRERPYRNAPRTLDLDLLLYGSARMESEHLTVPHARMLQRAFVLVPLAEISPERVTAQALQAVAHQRITRLGTLGD